MCNIVSLVSLLDISLRIAVSRALTFVCQKIFDKSSLAFADFWNKFRGKDFHEFKIRFIFA